MAYKIKFRLPRKKKWFFYPKGCPLKFERKDIAEKIAKSFEKGVKYKIVKLNKVI